MNIAFFDFDGTMTRRDSLFAFVAFVHGHARLYLGLLSRCWILAGYMLGLVSNTTAKQALMRYFFAKMSEQEFLGHCAHFSTELESMLKDSALERLAWHKQRGDRVVLVSASFEEYLAPLCKKLGMECIGTQLEMIALESTPPKSSGQKSSATESSAGDSGSIDPKALDSSKHAELSERVLSGNFATPNCYGEQKAARIRARYDLSQYAEVYAYGDSKGDREMLALATHAYYKPF